MDYPKNQAHCQQLSFFYGPNWLENGKVIGIEKIELEFEKVDTLIKGLPLETLQRIRKLPIGW